MAPDEVLNVFLTVMATVSMLVLVSIGLAVVYGMMGIINLAHGEFMMAGAFGAVFAYRAGVGPWLAILFGALTVALLGMVVEAVLIRFLYGRLEATILATWGLSIILVQLAVLVFGAAPRGIPVPLGTLRYGHFSVSAYSLLLMGAAAATLGLVYLVFKRTRFGIAARAVTQLPETAAALGINAARTNRFTFAFGAGLAGLGGALLAPVVGVLPSMGQAYVGPAFMTVVVGGPNAVIGTASAAGLLGSIDSLISNVTEPFIGAVALLVTAILIVRLVPAGLTGGWRRTR